MPELPEVAVYARNLAAALAGKRAEEAVSYHKRAEVPGFLPAVLREIRAEGKETVFRFDGGSLTAHLMLTGGYHLTGEEEAAAVKNKLFSLRFDDGTVLTVADRNRFATVTLGVAEGAPVPLTPAFSEAYFTELLARRPRRNIKALLTDRHCIRGIGNAYSDEILYRAKVSPLSRAGKIPPRVRRALYRAVLSVLSEAIEIIDAAIPGAVRGEYRDFLRVHRKGVDRTPAGEPILTVTLSSRKTYYTASQVLYR